MNAPRMPSTRRHSATKAPPRPRDGTEAGAGSASGAVGDVACCDRAQAQEREQRVERGKRCQYGEGPRGFIQRQPARRLSEQHGHVPAQRQNRAPEQRKGVHAQNWKSDSGVAERGRYDEASETQPGREIAHQKLHQRSQGQVADDQQHCGNDHHRRVALERDPEQPLQDQRQQRAQTARNFSPD